MNINLRKALEQYLKLVEIKYQETKMIKNTGFLKLIRNKELEFGELVNKLEKDNIFEQLIEETYKFFYGHYYEEKSSIINLSFQDMRDKTKAFFRKSGCYYNIFCNGLIDYDVTFNKFIDAFQRRRKKQCFLAPMEYVSFSENIMQFGQFKIQKFTANELEEILNNKINKIFYKKAYLQVEQLKELEDYWFICLTKKSPVHGYRGHVWEIESYQDVTHTDIEFPQLPIEILPFIKILSLFDWQADWLKKIKREIDFIETSAIKFKIPFVFVINDDLLEPPKDAPDLSILKKEIVTATEVRTSLDNNMEDINEDIEIDAYEVPERNIILDKERTNYFINFMNEITNVYSTIRIARNDWHFLDVSLNFFNKAFFSNGIDQLLWYITAIEALLGKKEHGSTRKLAARMARILVCEFCREEIKNRFDELYNFRCDLVHGRTFNSQIFIAHLLKARQISRRIIFWFIYFLLNIQEKIQEKKLTRDNILTLLDEEQVANNNLANNMPQGFPYVKEWIKW
jgi:hypothetical protein